MRKITSGCWKNFPGEETRRFSTTMARKKKQPQVIPDLTSVSEVLSQLPCDSWLPSSKGRDCLGSPCGLPSLSHVQKSLPKPLGALTSASLLRRPLNIPGTDKCHAKISAYTKLLQK